MRDHFDLVRVVREAGDDLAQKLVKIQLGQAGVQLKKVSVERSLLRLKMKEPTSVYIVSYAVLRVSRPSSTLCVQGPIWTVRTSCGLMAVSLYKLGKSVER